MRKPTPPPPQTQAQKPPSKPPLSNEQLRSLPVGGSSRTAILQATGGKAEKIGQRSIDNTFALNLWGRRFVYVRNQDLNAPRSTAYNTQGLKNTLDPNAAKSGQQLDHVASTGTEGGRIGNRYSLAAFVPTKANASHGRTNEIGPAPTREAAKAFRGGLDQKGKHHIGYMTDEMARKLAGKPAQGSGRSVLNRELSLQERKDISQSLMQSNGMQSRLKTLSQPVAKTQTPLAKQTTQSNASPRKSR